MIFNKILLVPESETSDTAIFLRNPIHQSFPKNLFLKYASYFIDFHLATPKKNFKKTVCIEVKRILQQKTIQKINDSSKCIYFIAIIKEFQNKDE